MKNKKGFTLVELLAVLVILALIVLLLSRTVIDSISSAKVTISESQEKAILNAAEEWAIDNSDVFDDIEGTSINVGLDVIFVVDVSGSMAFNVANDNSNSTSPFLETRYYAASQAISSAIQSFQENDTSGNYNVGFSFYSNEIKKSIPLRSVQGYSKTNPLEALSDSTTYYYCAAKEYKTEVIKEQISAKDGQNKKYVCSNGGVVKQERSGWTTKYYCVLEKTTPTGNYLPEKSVDDQLEYDKCDGKKRMETVQYALPSEATKKPRYFNVNYADGTKESIPSAGGTYTQIGLINAYSMLTPKSDTIPVIILLTDGEATYYSKNAVTTLSTSAVASGNGSSNQGTKVLSTAAKYTIETAWNIKQKLPNAKIYSIGFGTFKTDYSKFMIDPSDENITDNVKEFITNEKSTYDKYYPDKALVGSFDASQLKDVFSQIVTDVQESVGIVDTCITVKDLYDGGYINSKDINLATGDAASTYIRIQYNEATNQFAYAMSDEATCKDLLVKNNG